MHGPGGGMGAMLVYRGESFILPDTYDDMEVSAWYYDSAYTRLAGYAGQLCTGYTGGDLYAKRK